MRSILLVGLSIAIFPMPSVAQPYQLDDQNCAQIRIAQGSQSSTCDQNAARICQSQAKICFNICKTSVDPETCHLGCLNRYQECKIGAGCKSY